MDLGDGHGDCDAVEESIDEVGDTGGWSRRYSRQGGCAGRKVRPRTGGGAEILTY